MAESADCRNSPYAGRRAEFYGAGAAAYQCLPEGPRADMLAFLMSKIIQTPNLIVILSEDMTYRQIFMDGRALPKDPSPSFMGYSIGRWDGDILVVESTGFNDRTWLDFSGYPHTEALKMTERFRRTDFGHIELQVTFEDPSIYRKPITMPVQLTFAPDTEMLEFVCNENEKDRGHLVGKASDDLKYAVRVAPEVFTRYIGAYEFTFPESPHAPTIYNITPSGGDLFVDIMGKDRWKLISLSETMYSWMGDRLEFRKDEKGTFNISSSRRRAICRLSGRGESEIGYQDVRKNAGNRSVEDALWARHSCLPPAFQPALVICRERTTPGGSPAAGRNACPTRLCYLAVIAIYGVSAAFAQNNASISGAVAALADNTPLPKAAVRAKNSATGATFATQTAANGTFTLGGLPAGSYEVSAEFQLFIPKQEKITISAGQTMRVDFKLDDAQLGTLGDSGVRDVKLVTPQPAPKGPTPRMRDGKPDLSGIWLPAFPTDQGSPEPLPWAEDLVKQRAANLGKDWPQGHCLPNGLAFMGFFLPFKFVQTPTLLIIMDEADLPRQVFLDGRSHPKDWNPSFMGHSIGKWEKDTLVVDTVGINDRTWLNMAGLPHTEMMRAIERFRRPDLGHLEIELTIEDPGAYKKPWTMKRTTSLAPKDVELLEWVCTENNKDVQHLVGR